MNVGRLMTNLAYSCGPEQSLQEAAQIMWDHDCGCVPIVDCDNRLIGIITDRDIAMTAHLRGQPLAEILIGGVMQACVYSLSPSDSLTRAMQWMQHLQVHRLPVTDQLGVLVGIITLNDLALEAARVQRELHSRELQNAVAETLAAIGQHRAPSWRSLPERTESAGARTPRSAETRSAHA